MKTSPVTPGELAGMARIRMEEGWRFVTISCVELDADTVDLLYHFDKDLALVHYRLTAPKKEAIPSISSVITAAFLVENELQDQFGLVFEGLAIDFGQTLMTDESVSTSFCKYSISRVGPDGEES